MQALEAKRFASSNLLRWEDQEDSMWHCDDLWCMWQGATCLPMRSGEESNSPNGRRSRPPSHHSKSVWVASLSRLESMRSWVFAWAWYPWYRWLLFQLSKGSGASETARRRSSGSTVRIQALTFSSSFELPLAWQPDLNARICTRKIKDTFDLVSFCLCQKWRAWHVPYCRLHRFVNTSTEEAEAESRTQHASFGASLWGFEFTDTILWS